MQINVVYLLYFLAAIAVILSAYIYSFKKSVVGLIQISIKFSKTACKTCSTLYVTEYFI